jgi:hypothetical protein
LAQVDESVGVEFIGVGIDAGVPHSLAGDE